MNFLIWKGTSEDNLQQMKWRLKPALRYRCVFEATGDGPGKRTFMEIMIARITWGLGDSTLKAFQDCNTVFATWRALYTQYTRDSMINNCRALNNCLSHKYISGMNCTVHIAQLKAQFARHSALVRYIKQSIHVTVFMSLLIGHERYVLVISSIGTLPEKMETPLFVTSVSIEENKRYRALH